ncbi:unnamed protein product [Gongylonema pulchrum]|uniref:SH3 domain-containing protein n=1 Tax=Gongylonema pulchrum TaxID=637853 RepID=A0A183EJ00_9BILA|nr:unnamed protein product [Gongylonema pulchrum]
MNTCDTDQHISYAAITSNPNTENTNAISALPLPVPAPELRQPNQLEPLFAEDDSSVETVDTPPGSWQLLRNAGYHDGAGTQNHTLVLNHGEGVQLRRQLEPGTSGWGEKPIDETQRCHPQGLFCYFSC